MDKPEVARRPSCRASLASAAVALALLALIAAPAGAVRAPAADRARSAGSETLNEVMRMHVTSVKGKLVTAQGTCTGTVVGSISFKLVLSTATRASAEFSGSNSHGAVHGTGIANYSVAGAISTYTGTVTALGGSGRYAHARAVSLSFSGKLNRRTYEVLFQLHGQWNA